MMKKVVLMWILLICGHVSMSAQGDTTTLQKPLDLQKPIDLPIEQEIKEEEPKKLSWLRRTIRGFTYIDTNYVEPQLYDFTVMAQMTHTYDVYQLRSNEQSITFAPAPTIKVGPYFGWKWFFLGYTFDLKHLGLGSQSQKREIDFSIYTAQIGVDLFYRRTGSDYKIRNVKLGSRAVNKELEGLDFGGLNVGVTGFNLYYVFNHQRFSYPAAFAQSTRQKISCGSWLAGVGYTVNSLEFDHEKLQQLVDEHSQNEKVVVDSSLIFNSIRYHDSCASVGYAYNWVFAPNFLFCASSMFGLAYKRSVGEGESKKTGFDFSNVNFDYIGRFGVVYNDSRWYAGASAIIHAYTYRKPRFAANNVFGSLNVYVGYNFGRKKK